MVKIPGGTITVATGGANYIFPMMSGAYYGVSNVQMIELMFRPLYWFGAGYTPDLNPGLSVADPPVYSNGGRTVTVKMKGYKWADGETVDAQDVVFWMNMVKADATSWGGYVGGSGEYPGDVTNVVANDTTDTVTFSLDAAYSQYWFTYNELSQITPLPIRVGHHLGGRSSRLGGLFQRGVHVSSGSHLCDHRRSERRLDLRQSLCGRVLVSQWKDRTGRPRHLRHESALADRRRAVSPHLLRHDQRGVHPHA